MGKLRITDQGLKLYYGEAEFVNELRANLIRPSQVILYMISIQSLCSTRYTLHNAVVVREAVCKHLSKIL